MLIKAQLTKKFGTQLKLHLVENLQLQFILIRKFKNERYRLPPWESRTKVKLNPKFQIYAIYITNKRKQKPPSPPPKNQPNKKPHFRFKSTHKLKVKV